MKQDIRTKYNLPETIVFCKRCTISSQRPRIIFDEEGVCSACRFADHKKTLNWVERERELIELCNRHRRSDGSHDVIVPCSGGKDGSFVAHELKYKYGMNPLTVTWSPNIPTEIGAQNLRAFIDAGFDNVYGVPNGIANRKLVKLSFIHLGDPFQAFIYGQTNFPLRVSVERQISLIIYGENGEVEYGGNMKNAYRPTREVNDHDQHYFSGLPPEFWYDHGLTEQELYPYRAPPIEKIRENKTEIHFYSYYRFWDPQENFYYAKEHTGFCVNPERNEGTYSKYASLDDKLDGFHYYLSYIKFGIGRTTSDSAHEIRDGKITREEGTALVKRYDGEFPSKHYKLFLDYCGITEDIFWDVIESWRADHVWTKSGNDWALRRGIWQQQE